MSTMFTTAFWTITHLRINMYWHNPVKYLSTTVALLIMEAPANTLKTKRGFRRVINAFYYSAEGIGSTIKHEEAFRQEIYLASLMVPMAIILPVGLTGKSLLISGVLLVLIVELLNSGLEWAIDYISQEKHPFAKRAKDMGSAAVMLALINCGLVWALVIADHWQAVQAMFQLKW